MSDAAEARALLAGEDAARGLRTASLWRDTLGAIRRQRNAVIGLAIIGFLVLVAVLADVIAPYGEVQDFSGLVDRRGDPCVPLLGCTGEAHWFGIDGNFRDVLSRVIFGARVSLQVGVLTVGFAIILGSLIGAVAGFLGGLVDDILMRMMDVLLSFPSLLLAIAIVSVLGSGLLNAQLAIGLVAIPVYARVMRSSVLAVREQDFVTASRALGETGGGILFRRVIPNALTPLIVAGTLGVAGAVLDVAALSFLGLGAQPPTAEWGSMIGLERNSVFAAPHLIIFPGIAITLTVLGFNLLGDGLRDALDPRLNR